MHLLYEERLLLQPDCLAVTKVKDSYSCPVVAVGFYNHCASWNQNSSSVQSTRCGGIALFTPSSDGSPVESSSNIYVREGIHEGLPMKCQQLATQLNRLRSASYLPLNSGILDLCWIPDSVDSAERVVGKIAAMGSDCAMHFFSVQKDDEANQKTAAGSVSKGAASTESLTEMGESEAASEVCEQDYSIVFSSKKSRLNQDFSVNSTIGVSMDCLDRSGRTLAFCCSDGQISIVKDFEEISNEWKAHDFETWTIAFDPKMEGSVLASGADDCCLRIWDIRAGLKRPILENRRDHTMGVTAVKYYPKNQSLIYTGSYDEKIRVYDERNIRIPLEEIGASGGLWRFRWTKCRKTRKLMLLTASCFGGADIFRYEDADGTGAPELIYTLKAGPESLVYGFEDIPAILGDAVCAESEVLEEGKKQLEDYSKRGRGYNQTHSGLLCVSTSFYDKKLHLWEV